MTFTILALTSLLAAPAPAAGDVDDATRALVVAAVRARMGEDAEVEVEAADDGGPVAEAVDAVVEPGAALGRVVRVLLRAPVPRAGTTALVPVARRTFRLRVSVEHWHTTRPIARGTTVEAADLRAVRHALTEGPLEAPPAGDDLVGGAALRDLAADACVTARAVTPMPAVRAGEDVVAVVRAGGLEVRAALVAIDAGRRGARVRVRHPESKRTLTARVVGRGEVEVER